MYPKSTANWQNYSLPIVYAEYFRPFSCFFSCFFSLLFLLPSASVVLLDKGCQCQKLTTTTLCVVWILHRIPFNSEMWPPEILPERGSGEGQLFSIISYPHWPFIGCTGPPPIQGCTGHSDSFLCLDLKLVRKWYPERGHTFTSGRCCRGNFFPRGPTHTTPTTKTTRPELTNQIETKRKTGT